MAEFHYSFGFDGELDDPDREDEVKETIREFFVQRDDTEFIEFLGNPDNVPADVMQCSIRTVDVNGYDLLDELSGETGENLDNGVYVIQGGRESW